MKLVVDSLFQPLQVRAMRLENRMVMSPMTRCFSPGGVPGADVAAYYRRRAEGEAGLIITEGVGVDHPAAVDNGGIPLMYGDAALAGWRRVVDEVHAAGGRIFPQLWHQGPRKEPLAGGHFPDVPGMRPSGIWGPTGRYTSLDSDHIGEMAVPTRPMTDSEIADVIAGFARAARNAVAVGFDGIALHGAHGYLIDSFLWGETNLRTDRYGGDRRQRTRFAVEVVAAVRAAIGPDYPIMFRFSQWKMQDYDARLAATPQALEEILVPIAEAGVDIFDASTRHFHKPEFEDSTLNLAGWAKKLTGRVAMTVGGVGLDTNLYDMMRGTRTRVADNLPLLMARFDAGEFDLVGVGRSILADPQWPRRLRTGEPFLPFDQAALAHLH